MSNTDPSSIIILSEIIAFETILIIGLAVHLLLKKKKTIKLLKSIIAKYEKGLVERKSTLNSTYSKYLKCGSDENTKLIEDLIEHETKFFHSILDNFNRNDISIIKDIENEMHILVAPYQQLITNSESASVNINKEETTVHDIDSAIDDLLADEADDAEGDPALDLSETKEAGDEIKEIPEELLSEDIKKINTDNVDISTDDTTDPN
jgi:hypothetical protein